MLIRNVAITKSVPKQDIRVLAVKQPINSLQKFLPQKGAIEQYLILGPLLLNFEVIYQLP